MEKDEYRTFKKSDPSASPCKGSVPRADCLKNIPRGWQCSSLLMLRPVCTQYWDLFFLFPRDKRVQMTLFVVMFLSFGQTDINISCFGWSMDLGAYILYAHKQSKYTFCIRRFWPFPEHTSGDPRVAYISRIKLSEELFQIGLQSLILTWTTYAKNQTLDFCWCLPLFSIDMI